MTELLKIKNNYNLKLIEDCAEAIGTYFGKNMLVILVIFQHLVFTAIRLSPLEKVVWFNKKHNYYEKVCKLKGQGLAKVKSIGMIK